MPSNFDNILNRPYRSEAEAAREIEQARIVEAARQRMHRWMGFITPVVEEQVKLDISMGRFFERPAGTEEEE